MITAVDTNVLLDVLSSDEKYGEPSRDALASSLAIGTLVICEVAWAETVAAFTDLGVAESALSRIGVHFDPMVDRAANHAAQAWRQYRQRGGPRRRVIADFLIGAHAAAQADRLLSRDRGFYRTYFADVQVLDPSGR